MKSPAAKAWCCVGVMMLGAALMMSSIAFINNDVMFKLMITLGVICFIGGVILHFVIVKCPHCGTHLGRVYGHKCPFCGNDFNKEANE